MSETIIETPELEEAPRPNFVRRTIAKIKNPKFVVGVAAAATVTTMTVVNALRITELQHLLGTIVGVEILEAEEDLLELEAPEDSEDN